MTSTPTATLQRWFFMGATLFLVVAALYFAPVVIVPIAVAILLTFILAQIVSFLQSKGLGRILSVILVTTLVFAVLVSLFLVFFYQVRDLGDGLPKYKDQIVEKIQGLQASVEDSWLDRVLNFFHDLVESVRKLENQPAGKGKQPLPVVMETSYLPMVQAVIGSTLEFLVNAGLVLLLVIFMLLQREEHRNRVIRLWGNGSLSKTTRAMDEASQLISNFLLMQLLINGSYGVALGIGLWLIGIDYWFTWGLLAAMLRYIPYLGPWVAAFFPVAMSLLLPGWTPFWLVAGYVVLLELVSNNFMEPWLYGKSIGVSELALLISAAFWTWLWGPLGLVLSTPLTACLVVLGRKAQHLEFLHILLGDKPVLETHVAFYQRLLARDQDEATDLVEDYLKEKSVDEVYDNVLLPTLLLSKIDEEREELSSQEQRRIVESMREILREAVLPEQDALWVEKGKESEPADEDGRQRALIFGLPAHDQTDEVILEMFKEFLDPTRCRFKVVPCAKLLGEVLALIRQENPDIVFIGTLAFQRVSHSAYLCKRIRASFPELKIVVGCWGKDGEAETTRARLQRAGASHVGTTFMEARAQLNLLLPVIETQAPTDDVELSKARNALPEPVLAGSAKGAIKERE